MQTLYIETCMLQESYFRPGSQYFDIFFMGRGNLTLSISNR